MTEEIELQKQKDSLIERIKFLRKWITRLQECDYFLNGDAIFVAEDRLYVVEKDLSYHEKNNEGKGIAGVVEEFKKRIIFLKNWINKLREIDDKNKKDKLYKLNSELHHKQYLVNKYENDLEMFASQGEAIRKKVSSEMGTLIGKLRTARFESDKHLSISDTIIKRFSKNNYTGQQQQIADFKMAEALIKEAPQKTLKVI